MLMELALLVLLALPYQWTSSNAKLYNATKDQCFNKMVPAECVPTLPDLRANQVLEDYHKVPPVEQYALLTLAETAIASSVPMEVAKHALEASILLKIDNHA
jgi:exoribonuclease II